MGLRINSNIPSITALRTLRQADTDQRRSLERLSTGLRINRAADDASGLVISEQLRAQIASMNQALQNSQNASNLIGTADAALSEVSDLLIQIKESVVFALNSGGNDADQIAAEQDAIDNALSSIDRIAQTTKYGTRNLLDGSSGLTITGSSNELVNVNVQNVAFDAQTSQTFTLNVTSVASQGTLLTGAAYGGTSTAGATFRLTGSLGTQDISVASSTTLAQFNSAVNAFTRDTGVYASAGLLYTSDFGSDESISLEVTAGTLNAGGTLTAGSGVQSDTGEDLAGDVNGISFDADGLDVRVVSDVLTADIRVSDGTDGGAAPAVSGAYTFSVQNNGLTFQLNQTSGSQSREQVGIRSISTSFLGGNARTVAGIGGSALTLGGFLSTLESGGTNDLNSNAQNALRIIDDAITQVADTRAFLGAFQSNAIDTNVRSLGVAVENLTASESTVRDLDFAQETAAFTRNQIILQSGIAVLAQSNLISQSVLTLLG